ncbi:hypothetical protein A9179_00145 [Pseudomonas alcaligenes]|uniref:DUF2007 domain-containing protein n=1 Tax=Aquipseudomonas alcaligenes TaxID=43263 RepID=A0ABR7RWR5_AQUAC|nr:hypothetical protein [Pseudomonas alcaligenes]MBC9248673.1 hypothetical protein [Pseudomonas alcaligenes]
MHTLRASNYDSYIDFLRLHLNSQGIAAVACDQGADTYGLRYLLLLPQDADLSHALQALQLAPSEQQYHWQRRSAQEERLLAWLRSPAVRRFSLLVLAVLLLGMGVEALFS